MNFEIKLANLGFVNGTNENHLESACYYGKSVGIMISDFSYFITACNLSHYQTRNVKDYNDGYNYMLLVIASKSDGAKVRKEFKFQLQDEVINFCELVIARGDY